MWADAVPALGQVAVGAEDLKAGRIIVMIKPTVDGGAGIEAGLSPVFRAVIVDVVDGEEPALRLAAAGALAAIGVEGRLFQSARVFTVGDKLSRPVVRVPAGGVDASALSAPTEQAVFVGTAYWKRVLWLCLFAAETLFHSIFIISQKQL